MEIPCSNLTTRRKNSIFHIRNRGSIGLIKIIFKWVKWSWQLMASMMVIITKVMVWHMYGAMPCIYQLEYEKQTNQLHLNRNTWGDNVIKLGELVSQRIGTSALSWTALPWIFHSLWIKGEFTIFDLQLNFLSRFDERKIFESLFSNAKIHDM